MLCVTHWAYLAHGARDLYCGNGFESPGQEAVFLAYGEFEESIHVPEGREVRWRDFAGWIAHMRQAFRDIDAHQVFEEIRGVITAADVVCAAEMGNAGSDATGDRDNSQADRGAA